MQKHFYAVLFFITLAFTAAAAPGDTTWVQAHNNIQLTAYGAFDAAAKFPAGTTTYRKIYMVFTLGTYNCPGTPQYCHQWDYDVHSILMTPPGDTVEISRFITPYATSGVPRFPVGWTYRYIFDVTDYYPLMKSDAILRVFYSGYSFGFTADVKFAMIEGTPERDVAGVDKIWRASYQYGNAANPIDNRVTEQLKNAPNGTQSAELKVLITGHGSDPNQCCEFASHNYTVKVNNAPTDTKAIWRNDCGSNQLYPQGGTWIFNRANWCPGAIVDANTHNLTGISGPGGYSVDLDFDAYTNTSGSNYGSYNLAANVIYYGSFNKNLDASLEDIISPTDFEGHFRENPSDGKPVVNIRNSGSSSINSMRIRYGVQDSAKAIYDWTGNLAPLAETQITLPELSALKNLSLEAATGTYRFLAEIISVNGASDDDATNDTLASFFTVAPTWPNTFVVNMKTNSEGVSGIGQNPSETSWKITDAIGNIVASRTGADVSTTYSDTVSLPNPGFYKLMVTDGGCDGLHWWVWDQNPQYGITAGSIVIRNFQTGAPIPVKGNILSGTYRDDFGCGFVQNFTTAGYAAGVKNPSNSSVSGKLVLVPNPAHNTLNISLYGLQKIEGEIRIVDAVGSVVLIKTIHSAKNNLDISSLIPGIYHVEFNGADGNKFSERLAVGR